VFPGPEGYLRVESSAEYLGSRFLSFFGVLTIELITFQPCNPERGCRGGTWGSSGVDGSIGTSDGDGAVDGLLRIGRSFGGDLTGFALSGVWLTPRMGGRSFSGLPLTGVEGELKARPADRGRGRGISCMFPFSCIVEGRFLLGTDPKAGSGSL